MKTFKAYYRENYKPDYIYVTADTIETVRKNLSARRPKATFTSAVEISSDDDGKCGCNSCVAGFVTYCKALSS